MTLGKYFLGNTWKLYYEVWFKIFPFSSFVKEEIVDDGQGLPSINGRVVTWVTTIYFELNCHSKIFFFS